MPELPEVETVRSGLERHVSGRIFASVQLLHPRVARRHLAGPDDLAAALSGRRAGMPRRRGKYLWLPVGEDALLAHLGMSGQLVVGDPDRPLTPHVRARFEFADAGPDLRFVDQRTFGHLCFEPGGAELPPAIAHIAPDPLEPGFDDARFAARLRARQTEVKRALLDQSLISGIGNIYADEALWRAGMHWARATNGLRARDVERLVTAVREVFAEAIAAGGTSFDSLYVQVNGQSGYFSRSLAVYGRQGEPCSRCGALVIREKFMNRSSYTCPRCQPRPRRPSRRGAAAPGQSEPKGRGGAWTEKRGTSDEGRRRLKAPPRRAEDAALRSDEGGLGGASRREGAALKRPGGERKTAGRW